MRHFSYEHWLLYVKGKINEEKRREYEEHLYDCDDCLAIYLSVMDEVEQQVSSTIQKSTFTDKVLDAIAEQQVYEKQPVNHKPIIHYSVAAAMTLMLMFSGVFSHFTNIINSFENHSTKRDSSIVSVFMEKTISITDKVENESKEDK